MSCRAPRAVTAALSFQTFLRECICTSTCACVWTYMHAYAQTCIYACTCVCTCSHTRLNARACTYIYVHFFAVSVTCNFTSVLCTSAWARVYVTQVCFHTNVHICEHTRCRLCTYVYLCMCVNVCVCSACVYVCICMYVCLCICMHMHLYTRACGCTYALVKAHFVYLYCPISLLHARVSQVFLNTCMRVCGGIGSGICFSLFMVSACFWRGRLCFGRGRDRGFVLYISLFLRVLGWAVCVCLYTRVHTHKLLGYLM